MYWNLIWKSPGFVQFGVQSDPLWSQTYHTWLVNKLIVVINTKSWLDGYLAVIWLKGKVVENRWTNSCSYLVTLGTIRRHASLLAGMTTLVSQNALKLILKSHRLVLFGANLTQFGCQMWHPYCDEGCNMKRRAGIFVLYNECSVYTHSCSTIRALRSIVYTHSCSTIRALGSSLEGLRIRSQKKWKICLSIGHQSSLIWLILRINLSQIWFIRSQLLLYCHTTATYTGLLQSGSWWLGRATQSFTNYSVLAAHTCRLPAVKIHLFLCIDSLLVGNYICSVSLHI